MAFTASPSYRAAIWISIPQQVIALFLSCSILDFEEMKQICGISLLAFWACIGLIIFRRRLNPSRLDLWFIQFGFFPLFIGGFFLVFLIWTLRGAL